MAARPQRNGPPDSDWSRPSTSRVACPADAAEVRPPRRLAVVAVRPGIGHDFRRRRPGARSPARQRGRERRSTGSRGGRRRRGTRSPAPRRVRPARSPVPASPTRSAAPPGGDAARWTWPRRAAPRSWARTSAPGSDGHHGDAPTASAPVVSSDAHRLLSGPSSNQPDAVVTVALAGRLVPDVDDARPARQSCARSGRRDRPGRPDLRTPARPPRRGPARGRSGGSRWPARG